MTYQRYNRRILIITGAVILFLLIFFRERAQEPSREVVASIGDETITWADFITYAADINHPITDDERKALLDDMVMERLVQRWVEYHPEVQAIIEEGLQKERDYRYRALLQEELNRYMVEESVQVTEDDMMQFYLQQQPISLYHMTFSRLEPDARNRAELARNRLVHGEPWKKVVASVSTEDDPAASLYGYYLPGIFRMGDERYIAAAETLRVPGACTQPLPIPFGWMVLVRGDNPRLEDVKPLLQSVLEDSSRVKNTNTFVAGLRLCYTVNDSLLLLATDSLYSPDPKAIVVNCSHASITWESFSTTLRDLYFIDNPQSLTLERLHELAVEVADEEERIQMAEELKLAGTLRFRLRWEGVKAELETGRREKTFLYVQSLQANVSDEEIQAWYESHRNDYRRPDFYRLQKIVVNSEEKAKQVWQQASNGADFNSLVQQYSTRPGLRDSLGNCGLTIVLDNAALGTLYDTLSTLHTGGILEPRHEGESWAVYRLFSRIPGAMRSQSEVQSLIRRDIQMSKWRAWTSTLNDTAALKVETYYDVLLSKQFPPSRQRQ